MTGPLFLLSLAAATLFVTTVNGHGFLQTPRQRGILEKNPFTSPPAILTGVGGRQYDYKPHFPAGDKDDRPGSALASQIREAGPAGWTEYEPWKEDFIFRSGVCGDLKNNPEHMRGGRYYIPRNGPPKIVATYEQGGILSATYTVIGHHNGFLEFTVCDVKRCGGEISEACLKDTSICQRLLREPQQECQVGNNPGCGPIDPHYPTRFYMPCRQESVDVYGDGLMLYRLPKDLHCKHCVLQVYWVAANDCNPPGIVQYFKGPFGPEWGTCPGEGDAVGGYRTWHDCGKKKIPEEYYSCSDIAIEPISSQSADNTALKSVETKKAPAQAFTENPIQSLGIWVDGELKEEVKANGRAYQKIRNKPISLEARTTRTDLKAVYFYVGPNGKLWREGRQPYVFGGNRGKSFKPWKNPIKDKWFAVAVTAEDQSGHTYFFECQIFLQ